MRCWRLLPRKPCWQTLIRTISLTAEQTRRQATVRVLRKQRGTAM
nr:MAG TPA: hypothetical protein [Caudoviricetes sp.]